MVRQVVERGFNINKDSQVENLCEKSLVSFRLVSVEVLFRGDTSKLDIPPALALSCKQAYSKYKEELGDNTLWMKKEKKWKRRSSQICRKSR